MRLPLRSLACLAALPFLAAAYLGCSSDPPATGGDAGPSPTTTATTTSPTTTTTTTTTTTSSNTPPTDGAVPPPDSGPGVDAGCNYPKPVMDGGGVCGAYPFGSAAVTFSVTDAGGGFNGGAIPPGIYDAVIAERGSASAGSWRETLVLDGARFTRIRQIDTNGSSLGPVTQRSGTYTVTGSDLKLTYDCAVSGDAGVDAGSDTLMFNVQNTGCAANLRFGVAGVGITLKRRP